MVFKRPSLRWSIPVRSNDPKTVVEIHKNMLQINKKILETRARQLNESEMKNFSLKN